MARQSKPPTNFWWSLFLTALTWSTYTGFPLDTVNKEYYVQVLREFRKRFRRKRPALFKSSQWHQSTTPSLSQTIWPRWASRQIFSLPIVQTLLLVTFAYSLKEKLWGCRYETIEEIKEAVTKVIDMLTHEDFHGAFKKLLERYNKFIAAGGNYFERELKLHVCTIIHLFRSCILDQSLIQSMRQSGLFSDWLVLKLAWSSLIRLHKAVPRWQNSGSHCFSLRPSELLPMII